ncbi:MAG: zinc-binding dehydrogenase [Armatimonadota bacterium]
MKKTARAMVLEEFGQPLREEEVPLPELVPGSVLVRVTAAGICGSDLGIARGQDPRIRLPVILGHEGVGRVEAVAGGKTDILGHRLSVGDLVVWDRGLVCGACYQCLVKKRPALCPQRRVYGITMPADVRPGLNGSYAEIICLQPETAILKIFDEVDDWALVAATCSGATAAHSAKLANVQPGDNVAVLGPGPLGLFAVAFAMDAGARRVFLLGTQRGIKRMELGREMGAHLTFNIAETTFEERLQAIMTETHGMGADVVVDAAGNADSIAEAVKLAARGGTVTLPGFATPTGSIGLDVYEDIVLNNLRVQGVWVSDTSHLHQAVQLVLSGRYPLHKMVTHRFPLSQANEALDALDRREGIKVVLEPADQ